MRKAATALLVVAAGALLALVLMGASERRTLAFTLGAQPSLVAVTLQPGQEACQEPVLVEVAFDAIDLQLAGADTPGSRVLVSVRPIAGGAPLANAVLPTGSAPGARSVLPVDRVAAGQDVAICVRNAGRREVGVIGNVDPAVRLSTATLDGRPTGHDLDIVLRTTRERSTLALLPDMLARASVFRGGWSGPWLYWVLLVLVVVGVPALLLRALSASVPSSASDAGAPRPTREPDEDPRSADRPDV